MSKTSAQEAALKKRLQFFLADLAKIGTMKGFKHFSCYVRGKEELIISIKNTLPASTSSANALIPSQPTSRKQSLRHSDSLNSSCLPYDKSSLTLSHNTQVGLSGMREVGIGLPPASPSEEETTQDEDVTNFLIAGYSRYSCPYVWIRSNHQRLMKMARSAADIEKDSPLRLKSTLRWHEGDVYVYEIIAELVKLCMYPAPRNPFELDLGYFRNLSQPYQCVMTAAMISFLDRVITHSHDSCPYGRKVFQEHQLLSKLHFISLHDLIQSGSIPILKTVQSATADQSGRRSRQQQQQSSSSSSSSSAQRAHNASSTRTSAAAAHHPSPHHHYAQPPNAVTSPAPLPAVRATVPVNNARSVRYGQGPSGAFPGGFDRMPAPSMF